MVTRSRGLQDRGHGESGTRVSIVIARGHLSPSVLPTYASVPSDEPARDGSRWRTHIRARRAASGQAPRPADAVLWLASGQENGARGGGGIPGKRGFRARWTDGSARQAVGASGRQRRLEVLPLNPL